MESPSPTEQDRNAVPMWLRFLKQAGKHILSPPGIVGLLLGVSMTYWGLSQRTKALRIDYEAKVPILFVEDTGADDLAVTFRGDTVRKPYKLTGRLVSSGGAPVEPRDIESPVRLYFSKARILDAKSKATLKSDVPCKLANEGNVLVLDHKLLNPGDTVPFEVLCDGDPDWPTARARISGVPQITISSSIADRPRSLSPYTLILVAWGFLAGVFNVLDKAVALVQTYRASDPNLFYYSMGFIWAMLMFAIMTAILGWLAWRMASPYAFPNGIRVFA